ncbi:predicted protein, partial [Arabidopsis lyrata subsp. lyrata]
LGYADCDKLVERIHNFNFKELSPILLSVGSDLGGVLIQIHSSCGMKRIHDALSPALREEREESRADQTITLNAYVRRKEGNISFKDLSIVSSREAKCVLPHYYKCHKQLLDVVTAHEPPTYYHLSENSDKPLVYEWDKHVPVISIDPKSEGDGNTSDESTTSSGGFMKRGTKFMVTDDLIITPSNSTSTIGLLKEKQVRLDDVEIQVITIRKEEAIRLLEASLVTFSALSTSLLAMEIASTSVPQSRLFKKPKIET